MKRFYVLWDSFIREELRESKVPPEPLFNTDGVAIGLILGAAYVWNREVIRVISALILLSGDLELNPGPGIESQCRDLDKKFLALPEIKTNSTNLEANLISSFELKVSKKNKQN